MLPKRFLLRQSKQLLSTKHYSTTVPASQEYDAIIIGSGHNGLVCASYLAKQKPNSKILVLEKRHVVGGAAVTEEIVPGYKFSRASYLFSLFRPQILKDFNLREHLKLIPRNPSSFSPTETEGKFLAMGPDANMNTEQISKFSVKDAKNLPRYEAMLERHAQVLEALIDSPPFDPNDQSSNSSSTLGRFWEQKDSINVLLNQVAGKLGAKRIPELYDILTSPASKILDEYFESEPLKSTLSTDAIIGEFVSPSTPGSAYVLLHHVMGDVLGGHRGIWCYVEGGMGSVTQALSKVAQSYGVQIQTNAPVHKILTEPIGKSQRSEDGGSYIPHQAKGVVLEDGTVIKSKLVISNCNADTTFLQMLGDISSSPNSLSSMLPEPFLTKVKNIDYSSATCKINLAVSELPKFRCLPSEVTQNEEKLSYYCRGTIHFARSMKDIEVAYQEAKTQGVPSSRPVIEMTIPSALDRTVVPGGKGHVVQLFVQYAPYDYFAASKNNKEEFEAKKKDFAKSVYRVIDSYAPGFSSSVIGEDILSPVDLENVFGLKGGNIFHGSIALNQLYFVRPAPGYSRHRTPVKGLYLCGSSAHPGGGVMGAPGRNCSQIVLQDHKV